VSAGRLLAFSLASLAIIVVPGPSVLFVLARAISWGRAVAVLTVLGNSLGILVLASAVALGLGPLLTRSPALTTTIEVVGGSYLLWLGVDALRHRRAHAAALARGDAARPTAAQSVRQGFVVGVANPKAIVFFVAVFPHFVDPSKGDVTAQLLVLGVVFSVLALLSDGAWGLGAGAARDRLLASPGVLVGLRTAGGVVMLALGTLIIVSALV
jgi:threonine/homoserine/homoserine lactone efflux protein